ncbi:MAG: asparagine synthase (glutamine-hydrolyzing) [Candidatus Omnitrophica bacterium]|nr:asparagine synthase (glutamine-hydrolyzing) [Candidatus Omnitrophota bacterium]
MCGIIAHVAFDDSQRISEEAIHRLNQLHHHRGPDDGGVYVNFPATLACRRLSIVDVKGGHQPVVSCDGRYAIVFNGEIYNHRNIRQELEKRNYRFKSHGDTETVLAAFIDRGPECLNSFNGMFAFAIWDNQKQELFVARDRVGIKPLYFAVDRKCVLFSSELSPIIQSELFDLKIDPRAVADYLAYWYVCEPRTIFQGVSQLAPGHYGVIKNRTLQQTAYWRLPHVESSNFSFSQAAEHLHDLLDDAVKIRIPDEVPFGTFLSGGIDSGVITALSARHVGKRLEAFSIGFKEASYSEVPQAMRTAQRNNANLDVTNMPEVTAELITKITCAFDEPLGNASYVPTYVLAQHAARKVKVVLTGDGGDELFGGYPTYQAPYYQAIYRAVPSWMTRGAQQMIERIPVSHNRISLDFRLKQFMRGASLEYPRAHFSWRQIASIEMQKRLLKNDVLQQMEGYDPFCVLDRYFSQASGLSVRNQLMFADVNTFLLNDHLRKVDRMTMSHSLEARLPFLDYRIINFAIGLPADYKVKFSKTKVILKQVAKRYLTPDIIQGKKKGLTSPIAGWLANELRDFAADTLRGGLMDDLFNANEIQMLLREHQQRVRDHSRVLWALIALQIWYKNLTVKRVCAV